MPMIDGSKIAKGIYGARDAIELTGKIPRNSMIPNVAHLVAGVGIVGGVVGAQALLLPSESEHTGPGPGPRWTRERAMEMGFYGGLAGAGAIVVLTAGMQLGSMKTGATLPRGLTPMYFLAVGALGGAALISGPVRNALEQ